MQLMFSLGHGTWYCHYHSTGLSQFLVQNPCLSPGGLSEIAILLVIAFLVLVALAVVKQGTSGHSQGRLRPPARLLCALWRLPLASWGLFSPKNDSSLACN